MTIIIAISMHVGRSSSSILILVLLPFFFPEVRVKVCWPNDERFGLNHQQLLWWCHAVSFRSPERAIIIKSSRGESILIIRPALDTLKNMMEVRIASFGQREDQSATSWLTYKNIHNKAHQEEDEQEKGFVVKRQALASFVASFFLMLIKHITRETIARSLSDFQTMRSEANLGKEIRRFHHSLIRSNSEHIYLTMMKEEGWTIRIMD